MTGSGPFELVGLDGFPTPVRLEADRTWGLDGGSGWPGNTGDFNLLLNDSAHVGTLRDGGSIAYTWTGLKPGAYRVYTYAVDTAGYRVDTPVFVPNSTSENPQIVTGPMPGNAFSYHITHAVHDVAPDEGILQVIVEQPPGLKRGFHINGFQIVSVPEPGTMTILAVGALFLLARRRRE